LRKAEFELSNWRWPALHDLGKSRLVSLSVILVIGFLLLVSLVISIALAAFSEYLDAQAARHSELCSISTPLRRHALWVARRSRHLCLVPLSAEREWLFRYRSEAAANFASRSAPAVGGDGMLYVADTRCSRPRSPARSIGVRDSGSFRSRPALPLHGGNPGPAVRRPDDAGWDPAWHL
jgi:hypothetical protein